MKAEEATEPQLPQSEIVESMIKYPAFGLIVEKLELVIDQEPTPGDKWMNDIPATIRAIQGK